MLSLRNRQEHSQGSWTMIKSTTTIGSGELCDKSFHCPSRSGEPVIQVSSVVANVAFVFRESAAQTNSVQ